jgi:hypothetical protein
MNERINELAEQANLYARSDNSSMVFENYQKRYTEKFAELIVRECAEYVKYNNNFTYSAQADLCAERMKQRFGVEK